MAISRRTKRIRFDQDVVFPMTPHWNGLLFQVRFIFFILHMPMYYTKKDTFLWLLQYFYRTWIHLLHIKHPLGIY